MKYSHTVTCLLNRMGRFDGESLQLDRRYVEDSSLDSQMPIDSQKTPFTKLLRSDRDDSIEADFGELNDK